MKLSICSQVTRQNNSNSTPKVPNYNRADISQGVARKLDCRSNIGKSLVIDSSSHCLDTANDQEITSKNNIKKTK